MSLAPGWTAYRAEDGKVSLHRGQAASILQSLEYQGN